MPENKNGWYALASMNVLSVNLRRKRYNQQEINQIVGGAISVLGLLFYFVHSSESKYIILKIY